MKNPLQRAIKRLSHRLIPPSVLKHQIAHRNWRRGEIEIRYLDRLVNPTQASIDIGAYLGAYTYYLAKLTKHVHAFEPQLYCNRFLSKAFGTNVSIYDCALSNYEGQVAMRHAGDAIPNQGASLESGEKTHHSPLDNASSMTVEVKRLDSFGLSDIGFIKIDAEGEETNVLEGAEETIANNRPTLLIEIEQRHRQGDIYEVFRGIEALGYRGEFICDGEIRSLKTFSVDHHQHARLAGDRTKPYINNFIFRANS